MSRAPRDDISSIIRNHLNANTKLPPVRQLHAMAYDERFSVKRQLSRSPPHASSEPGIPKKLKFESSSHQDRDTSLHRPSGVLETDSVTTHGSQSYSPFFEPTNHATIEWYSDAHCRPTSEPSWTSDSPQSTHSEQFSVTSRPSSSSSHDFETVLEHTGVGLGFANTSYSTGSGESGPMDTDMPTDDSAHSSPAEESTISTDLPAPRPTSPSERNDGSSTAGESKSSLEAQTEELEKEDWVSDNDLGQLIREVLGDAVGKQFHKAVKGTLQYMPQQKVKSIEELSGLSLLDAFTLEIAGKIPYTVAASESSGGSSASSNKLATPGGKSSSGGGSSSRNNSPRRGGAANSNNNQSGQDDSAPTAGTEEAGPGTPPSRRRNLRCPFNAAAPHIFCVTKTTGRKFAPCEGPGYNTMQYLKEHLQKTHRPPKDKKKDHPRCGSCQVTFETNELLQDHVDNVDCPVKCPECMQEFKSKPARKTHHDEKHATPDRNEIALAYIDDEKYKEMKGNLKGYSESLRKGKRTQDDTLADWISKNTEEFMKGRDPDTINPQLQLGQWYIMFTTVLPDHTVPADPFYDLEDVVIQGEVVIENIMFIWKKLIQIKRNVGPVEGLPTDIDNDKCLSWFEDHLRQTLTLASRTTLDKTKLGKIHIPDDGVLDGDTEPQLAPSMGSTISQHHHFSELPLQPLSSTGQGSVQNHIQPAGSNSNPQGLGLYPSTGNPDPQYGSALQVDTRQNYDFPIDPMTGNWSAMGYNNSGQPYPSFHYEAYGNELAETGFPPISQLLDGDPYSQLQAAHPGSQGQWNGQPGPNSGTQVPEDVNVHRNQS
ncbi:hypothetical protein V8F06_007492 [Rhypophila decipiens]